MKGVGFDLIGPLLNPTDCMFNLFSSLWQRSFCVEIRFTWICSMLAATLVILSGIFPVLFIPVETGTALRGKGFSLFFLRFSAFESITVLANFKQLVINNRNFQNEIFC